MLSGQAPRKNLPRGRQIEQDANHLRSKEKAPAPGSSRMQLAVSPDIVDHQCEEHDIGQDHPADWRGQAEMGETRNPSERCRQDCGGPQQHQPFVPSCVFAHRHACADQGAKREYRAQRENQWWSLQCQMMGCGNLLGEDRRRDAQWYHDHGQSCSRGTDDPVNVSSSGRDQSGLRDVENDPSGEHDSVDVQQQGQRLAGEYRREIVGRREADERRDANDTGHRREEPALVGSARRSVHRRCRHEHSPLRSREAQLKSTTIFLQGPSNG